MYRIERACRKQIAAQSGEKVLRRCRAMSSRRAAVGKQIFSTGGFSPAGGKEVAATVRTLDREQPDYAR
jgi:predicted phage gp36 major capsid-like protein